MSYRRSPSVGSTCSILSCTSEQFWEFYDANYSTDILSEDMIQVIIKNQQRLQLADGRYRLDDLLFAMLEHAPHPHGKRYVAVCLHIAHTKGEDMLVDIARAWMDNLFFPILAFSKAAKTEPSSSQTPTIDTTVQFIEAASRSEQSQLRAQVAARELYRCAITQAFDVTRASALSNLRRYTEIPDAAQSSMEAAYIVPWFLNKFDDNAISGPEPNAARTWDMLQSWTQLDIKKLEGEKINLPTNAIYMTSNEHRAFKQFVFYLDKDAYPHSPNKYRAQMAQLGMRLSNGQLSADVEFQTDIDPPDPLFLKVHAAFAKVLNLCGAAEYLENVEREAESTGTLRLDGGTDFALFLMTKLSISAH